MLLECFPRPSQDFDHPVLIKSVGSCFADQSFIFRCGLKSVLFGFVLPKVVIDEVAGFFVTLTWLPVTWQTFLAGFILFRLLDIWKPLFIGVMDRKIKGGAGTVLDDIAAGIVANLILQAVYYRTDWLGWRWSGG